MLNIIKIISILLLTLIPTPHFTNAAIVHKPTIKKVSVQRRHFALAKDQSFNKYAFKSSQAVSLSIKSATTEKASSTAIKINQESSSSATKLDKQGALENLILALINKERLANNLPELVMNERLRQAARSHSADMVKNNFFDHNNLRDQTPYDRIKGAGVNYRTAGENIAYASSLEENHENLLQSPPHRANILSSKFHQVGIGIAFGPGTVMVTQDFTD